MQEKNKDQITLFGESVTTKKPLFILGAIVIFLWGLAWVLLIKVECSPEARGQFGDMFGVFTALMSGLTLAGLIYTILLQQQQIRQQQEDIGIARQANQLNKDELVKSNTHFEKQNTTLAVQRFENTFFNMITIFQNISSPELASSINRRLREPLSRLDIRHDQQFMPNMADIESIQHKLTQYISPSFRAGINQYIGNLSNLATYIENSILIQAEDRRLYINIISANVHTEWKILLFYDRWFNSSYDSRVDQIETIQRVVNIDDYFNLLLYNNSHRRAVRDKTSYYDDSGVTNTDGTYQRY